MRKRFQDVLAAVTPFWIYISQFSKILEEVDTLPRKGYKCITVDEKLHANIKKRAKETNRTIREYVEYLLAKEKTTKNS